MKDDNIKWELEYTYIDYSCGLEAPCDTFLDDTLYTDKEDAYKAVERLDGACEATKEFSLIEFTLRYFKEYNDSLFEYKETWDIYDFRKWREEVSKYYIVNEDNMDKDVILV